MKIKKKKPKKNYNKIPEWMEQNPECEDMENQKYDFCFTMMRHAIGEMGEEQVKIDEKVLRNVAKEVIINKSAIKSSANSTITANA